MNESSSVNPSPTAAEAGSIHSELANLPLIELPKDPDKPLVGDRDASSVAGLEAYKSLRTRLSNASSARGFRTVAVTSAAQSDGKTLTSINLAYCCAQLENASILIVDADLRTRGLSDLIGGSPVPGLSDVLAGEATYQQAIRPTDVPRLAFMSAGMSSLSPAELFSRTAWKTFIAWAAENFSLVIVDSQPIGVVADYELIAAQCEGVILVVRALRTSKDELKEAVAAIEPKKMIGVVWNGAELSKKSYYYEARV